MGQYVWQGACMAGGVHGAVCVAGGHAWQGVCMGQYVWQGGHAWQGVCMGQYVWQGVCMVGIMHGRGVRGSRDGH